MSTRKNIIHIGIADPPRSPQFTMNPEDLRAVVERGADKARAVGFDITTNYVPCADIENNPSKVLKDIEEQLRRLRPLGLIIGGGLKMMPGYTALFESLVNLIRLESPNCKLGFQGRPDDIDEVCERLFAPIATTATTATTNTKDKKVIHIGLGDAPPGFNMTDEQIREAVKSGADKAQSQGFDVSLTFIMSSDIHADMQKVLDQIRGKIRRLQPFGVIVGGGVKTAPPLVPFFEQIIEIARSESPDIKLGFQSKPDDIWEVCERFN